MNRTWTRYSNDAGRQRECRLKLTPVVAGGWGRSWVRSRGTTRYPKQRSDTGKGSVDQGTKVDAPAQPRRLALLEGGSAIRPPGFHLLLLRCPQAPSPLAVLLSSDSTVCAVGGRLTSWCSLPLELLLWSGSSADIFKTPSLRVSPVLTVELDSRDGVCVFPKAELVFTS